MTTSTPSVPATIVGRRLARQGLDVRNRAFELVLLLSLLASLAVLIALVWDVLNKGGTVFESKGADFILGDGRLASSRDIDRGDFGSIWLGLRGSLTICAIVAIVAFPVGIATAVYLEEYAHDNRLTRFININIRNLAGVPSVVYGLLGVGLFVGHLRGLTGGRTVLAAGLTLAALVLPVVIITSSEAIRAVPGTIREAGFGVGASRWEVIRSLVLPSAAPGILTGTVLAISRAVGESAPILLIGAATTQLVTGDLSFFDQLTANAKFTALPALIAGSTRQPDDRYINLTAAMIVVLLAITLIMNAAAIILRNRYEKRW